MNRLALPFRQNCEGYFTLPNDELVIRDTGEGYLELPGGGVNPPETPEVALKREALEEAGVILKSPLKKVKVLRFIWGPDWAKTEKQKRRFQKFKGEEMHFFTAEVEKLVNPTGDATETGWRGKRTMKISKALQSLENSKPFSEDIREYREFQIEMLRHLRKHSESKQ